MLPQRHHCESPLPSVDDTKTSGLTRLVLLCMPWQMVGLSLSPESPVWLRWVHKTEAAQAAQQRLLGYR